MQAVVSNVTLYFLIALNTICMIERQLNNTLTWSNASQVKSCSYALYFNIFIGIDSLELLEVFDVMGKYIHYRLHS